MNAVRWSRSGSAILSGALACALAASGPACGYTTSRRDATPPGTGSTELNFTLQGFTGAQTWARESVHLVQWSTAGLPETDQAAILVSYDHGAAWAPVGAAAATSGQFAFTVPADAPDRVRLRVLVERSSADSPEVALTPSQRREYRWTRMTADAAFGPRDGAGALTYNGRMWLIGGWNGDRFPRITANDVWSSVDGAAWTQEKPNTFLDDTFDASADWEGRHISGYEVHDGKMWIIAGDPLTGHYQRDVWSSTDGRKWTRAVAAAAFPPRALHLSAEFQGRLWVMGGQRIEQFAHAPGETAAVLNDVWSSPNGVDWTQTQTKGPMWEPRGFAGRAVTHLGRLWVVGGGTYEDPSVGRPDREFRADAWSTADGATWIKEPELPPFSAREAHDVVAFDGRLWVVTGYNPRGNLNDAWYTLDGKNWYESTPPPKPYFLERHAASVWVHDGALFVGAGAAWDSAWHADVWRIDVAP